MIKKFFTILSLFILFIPACLAADEPANSDDQMFKAKVMEILSQKEIIRDDGSKATQQNLLLKGLEKEWKDKEFEYQGIGDLDVISSNTYKVGDKVLASQVKDTEGRDRYYVHDLIRTGYLWLLLIIFILAILISGGIKGFKSLISLVISFFIITKFMIPEILKGASPLLISLIGTTLILLVIIYVTEGINRKSHLGVASVFFSLFIVVVLSEIFTFLMRLNGLAGEETMFLIGSGTAAIDFHGLLLAGIMIGSAGVLDDVIIGQIEAVKQIKEVDQNLDFRQTFKRAYAIGNTHLGAIINTLFLTYAGASLPLLLLFSINSEAAASLGGILNMESISTEIVRTLVGSIGIALALPIATFLAAKWLVVKK